MAWLCKFIISISLSLIYSLNLVSYFNVYWIAFPIFEYTKTLFWLSLHHKKKSSNISFDFSFLIFIFSSANIKSVSFSIANNLDILSTAVLARVFDISWISSGSTSRKRLLRYAQQYAMHFWYQQYDYSPDNRLLWS